MRYDFTEKIPFKEFTKEFYEEIDSRLIMFRLDKESILMPDS